MNADERDFVNYRGQRVRWGAENRVTVDGEPIPDDQRWFWTEEWQAGEAEAAADIAAGRVERFTSMEELHRALEAESDGG